MLDHIKENERQFKEAKKLIGFSLRGNNKYYYANQCAKFTKHILNNGIKQYKASDIAGVSFNANSIKIRFILTTATSDIERFETKKEMLSFVIGFNTCSSEVA